MLEHIDTLSQTAAQAISNIKFDKVIVWENGGANGHGATAGFLQNMAKTLPPVLQIMENIGGVKMPEFFGKMVDAPPPTPPTDPKKVAANGHSETAKLQPRRPDRFTSRVPTVRWLGSERDSATRSPSRSAHGSGRVGFSSNISRMFWQPSLRGFMNVDSETERPSFSTLAVAACILGFQPYLASNAGPPSSTSGVRPSASRPIGRSRSRARCTPGSPGASRAR